MEILLSGRLIVDDVKGVEGTDILYPALRVLPVFLDGLSGVGLAWVLRNRRRETAGGQC